MMRPTSWLWPINACFDLFTPLGHRLSLNPFTAFSSKIKWHQHDGNCHLGNVLLGVFQLPKGGICSALQKSFHLDFSPSSSTLLRLIFGVRFLDRLFIQSQWESLRYPLFSTYFSDVFRKAYRKVHGEWKTMDILDSVRFCRLDIR